MGPTAPHCASRLGTRSVFWTAHAVAWAAEYTGLAQSFNAKPPSWAGKVFVMAKTAYFDCLSGISGDMTLGALIDLGADLSAIQEGIQSMGLGELEITTEIVKKCGFRAVYVRITHPPEHAHRHLHHIEAMIDRAGAVTEPAKIRARQIFMKLAEAEAKVHGSTIQKVHFHEVGAIDSIADIVGTAIAMDLLGIEDVQASPVPTGTGFVTIAHGRVSIPAPATAELLCGIPIAPSCVEAELTTPTGAAILKATSSAFGPIPKMTISAVGYGAGTKDLPGQANVLRIFLGTTNDAYVSSQDIVSDRVVVMETNIDDSTPQQLAYCSERLFDAGALDVYQTPCAMKKGRVGVLLTVLGAESRVEALESIIFEHTTSIGIRRHVADRHKLVRESVTIETLYGPVRGKVVRLPNNELRVSIEDDDATAIAVSGRVAIAEVKRIAEQVWRAGQK
jgi:pyridinium-3,5-bisthiocarboxylic acid mononucleotide nickel chelatase